MLIAVVFSLLQPLFMQVTGAVPHPPDGRVSVPFKGCASWGQTDRAEAPKGANKTVSISPTDAQWLAYYESGDGLRLLAPRGWYCQGAWGSGGGTLFVSPKPIDSDASGWHGLEGPAISIYHFTSEASGRYDVAEITARVFPEYRASAIRTLKGMNDFPVPRGPYPKDTLRYRGKRIVEYETPAQTEGLGNHQSWLGKSDRPIVGAAILILQPPHLIGGSPNLVLLSVRLPPELASLAPTIVQYVERDLVDGLK